MPGFPTGVSPMMVADISNIGGRGYSYSASALEQTPQWQVWVGMWWHGIDGSWTSSYGATQRLAFPSRAPHGII
jgi:hypothetical protein